MSSGITGIIEKLNKSNGEDIFLYWEREIQARKQVREARTWEELSGIEPERETIDFLFRTFFPTSRRNWFYRYLLKNSHTMSVIRWLISCPRGIKRDFLTRLPLLLQAMPGQNLDFLINIYTTSSQEVYRRILFGLDQQTVSRLMGRTANPELRRLLRERRDQLQAERQRAHMGLELESIRVPGWESFYGNKVELGQEVLAVLQEAGVDNFNHPYSGERLTALVQAVEALYRLGWVQDSLVLLVETYQDFMARSRLPDPAVAQVLYHDLDRMARMLVPVYCLLEYPTEPGRQAREIYRWFLPQLTLEEASVAYLDFLVRLPRLGFTDVLHLQVEVKDFCELVGRSRIDDEFIRILQAEELDSSDLSQLVATARERLKSRPHETLVILELVRALVAKGRVEVGPGWGENLFQTYLELWHWIPSRIFLNQVLLDTLIPGLGVDRRRQASQVREWLGREVNQILEFYRDKPDLARTQGSQIALEMVFGKLLGVQ